MKILKAQSGVVYTPEIRDVYIPTQQATKSAGSTSSSTSEKMDDMTKEILSTLDTNGIPVDVEVFGQYMNNLLSNARSMYSTGSTSHTIQQLIALKGLANKVSYSKTLGEAARKRLASENTGSDVALTSNGYLYAKTEDGELTAIDPDTYYKNKDEYELLNNNELLHLRETTSALAMNTSILNDLSNSVGMKAVMDQIVEIIQKFGENKSTAYTQKQGQSIQKGLEALMSGGPDGYYRVTTSTDKGASQADMAEAISYLYRNLTANAKNTLRANVAANGANPDSAKGVAELLQKALYFNTSSDIDVNYDKSASEAAGGGSGSGGDKNKVNVSYAEEVAYGRVVDPKEYVFSTSDGKHGISVLGQAYPWLDYDDKQLEANNIKQLLIDSPLGVMIDKESISFGDKVINDVELNRIIWDGASNVVQAWLPKDLNAEASGILKPDFDSYEKFEKFTEWVKQNPGVTSQQQQSKMHELGLRLVYNQQTGTWDFPKEDMQLFLITSGYTSDQVIDTEDSKWMDEVSRDEGSRILKLYTKLVNFGKGDPSKSAVATDDVKLGTPMLRWLGANGASSFVKSSIFMPIIDQKMATVATTKEYVPRDYYSDVLNRANYKKQQQSITTNF